MTDLINQTNKTRGLIAAPFTPFDKNGDLNLDQIATLARSYEANGVKGAFIAGTTGEGPSLGQSEKLSLMVEWSKVKGSGLTTVMMLGGTAIPEMQDLAIESQKNDYDAVSILSPFYFVPTSVDSLVDYCAAVASVVPDMPFYYYHIPGLTKAHFRMVEFLKIAEEKIPNLKGIKYSQQNLMDFHACLTYGGGKYEVLWGTDEALLAGLATGGVAAVGSTYNYAAPLYNQIIKAFNSGNHAEAEILQRSAVKTVELLIKYGGIGAGKAIMKIIGIDCGWCRLPIAPLTSKGVKDLERDLEQIGFFDFCSK